MECRFLLRAGVVVWGRGLFTFCSLRCWRQAKAPLLLFDALAMYSLKFELFKDTHFKLHYHYCTMGPIDVSLQLHFRLKQV